MPVIASNKEESKPQSVPKGRAVPAAAGSAAPPNDPQEDKELAAQKEKEKKARAQFSENHEFFKDLTGTPRAGRSLLGGLGSKLSGSSSGLVRAVGGLVNTADQLVCNVGDLLVGQVCGPDGKPVTTVVKNEGLTVYPVQYLEPVDPDAFPWDDPDDAPPVNYPKNSDGQPSIFYEDKQAFLPIHGFFIAGKDGGPDRFVVDKPDEIAGLKPGDLPLVGTIIADNTTAGLPYGGDKSLHGYLLPPQPTEAPIFIRDSNGTFADFFPENGGTPLQGILTPSVVDKPSKFYPVIGLLPEVTTTPGTMKLASDNEAAPGLQSKGYLLCDKVAGPYTFVPASIAFNGTFSPKVNPSIKIEGFYIPGAPKQPDRLFPKPEMKRTLAHKEEGELTLQGFPKSYKVWATPHNARVIKAILGRRKRQLLSGLAPVTTALKTTTSDLSGATKDVVGSVTDVVDHVAPELSGVTELVKDTTGVLLDTVEEVVCTATELLAGDTCEEQAPMIITPVPPEGIPGMPFALIYCIFDQSLDFKFQNNNA